MIYNSIYEPSNTLGGVLGTSLIDLTTTSFAQMFANAANFSSGGNYIVGNLVYDQGAVWVCKVATSGANPPPTLPTLRNAWWEFVGSQGTFTWIAYADSPTGFVGLPNVSITGTAGQFSCTSSTIVVGDIVTISGTLSGTGSISGYSGNPTSYLVSATNGTTTFTLTKADGSAIVTTAGTTVGLSFIRYTLSDFTTDLPGTRKYIGISANRTSATESTLPANYIWSRFVGQDGAVGVSPILISLSKPSVAIATDSNGDNAIFTGSGTEIRVVEGQTTLSFDGTGTSGTGNAGGGVLSGTWKINSRVATGVTLGSTITDSGTYATVSDITAISADTGSIVYTITGTNSSGIGFTISATQTFVRLKGVVVDINPPGAPTGLTLTSSTVTTPAGDIQAKLSASWNANTEADLSYYEVQIKEGTGSYISYNAPSNSYEWTLKPNTAYTVQVRAIDKSDNRSAYGTEATLTTAKDNTAPSAPTNISAVATFKSIFLTWTNPTVTDLAYVDIWRNTTNNTSSATKISTVRATSAALTGTVSSFTDSSNLTNGTLYYYWLKAVDTSGNTSTAFSTLTTSTLSSVTITGTAGQFSCTSTTLKIGQVVIISGTLGGTGSITGYTNPTTYVISATNGTTTFTLVKADGTALVTTTGTPTGLTYTKHESAAVPAAVGTADIIAGSITADRIQTGAITSDIISVGTGLNSSIIVSGTGTTLGAIQSNAATGATDPVTRINAGTTTIDPGKILISGTTYLSNWRNGTDATKIEGGSIATNTISANKVQIGIRGVDISDITFQCSVDATTKASTNVVTWTAGTIVYTNDAGTITTASISSGTSTTWSSGIMYFYWTKGGTTIDVTTATATAYGADKIVLATYSGGFNLIVNYGKTIVDGSQITTGTITGTQVKANSITASQINSNGLSIRDNSGNIILAAGSGVDFANLSLSFPNATNITSVSNSNIAVNASGQITGIGTGANTVVANSQITINSNGTLGGAGAGQVTLPGLGNNYFRISATGLSATSNGGLTIGFYVNGSTTALTSGGRSYTVVKILRSTGAATVVGTYDVFASTANATAMATALNAINSDNIVVVFSGDEPQTNRLFGTLPAAMYRHGASRGIFGSSNFKFRSAYILIGIGGCGEGNGAELYQGSVDSDTSAWVDAGFSVINGVLSGVSTSAAPRTLSDYGYTGDLNATNGAVIGTNLTGTFTEPEFNARFNTNIIGGTYIKDATILTAKIADAQILTAKIADAAITTAKIADANITTAKIADANITNAKIGSAAITAAKIGDLEVSTLKIQGNAVTIPTLYSASDVYLTQGVSTTIYESPSFVVVGDIVSSVKRGGAIVVAYFNMYTNGDTYPTGWDVGLSIDIYVNKDDGAGFIFVSNQKAGIGVGGGKGYGTLPVAICTSITDIQQFKIKLTGVTSRIQGSGDYNALLRNIQVSVMGGKR